MGRLRIGNAVKSTARVRPGRGSGTVLGLPGTVSPNGLRLPTRLTFEEWDAVGHTLQTIVGAALWWIGDWYLYGEGRFGEDAAQAIGDDTGYSARTVQQAAWVSSRFPVARRLESVSWNTHMAFAGVEDEAERYGLLAQAARERWTVRQAREKARSLKRSPESRELPAIAQREGRSADVGAYVLTLYDQAGTLIVQRRDRRTDEGMILRRSALTDEAKALLQDFLSGSAAVP